MSDNLKCEVCGKKEYNSFGGSVAEQSLKVIRTPDCFDICSKCLLEWATIFGQRIRQTDIEYLRNG